MSCCILALFTSLICIITLQYRMHVWMSSSSGHCRAYSIKLDLGLISPRYYRLDDFSLLCSSGTYIQIKNLLLCRHKLELSIPYYKWYLHYLWFRYVINVTWNWRRSRNIIVGLVGGASVMTVQPIREQFQKEAGLHLLEFVRNVTVSTWQVSFQFNY